MNKTGQQGLVSVITPFRNAAGFLRDAIESVLAQTYCNWELLLIDDGSTDEGTAVAQHFAAHNPERIRYFEHAGHAHRGVCRTRNVGVKQSRGEYIALLDADDVWFPNKLQDQVACMLANPTAGLVYGNSLYWFDWQGDQRQSARNHIPQLMPGNRLYEPRSLVAATHPLGRVGMPCPSDFLLRRDAVITVGAFEEVFDEKFTGLNIYEDVAFLTKIYLHFPVYVSEACWDKYRCHLQSMTASAQRAGVDDVTRRFLFDWLKKYLLEHDITDADIWAKMRKQTWNYEHPVMARGLKRAKQLAKRILRRAPANPEIYW